MDTEFRANLKLHALGYAMEFKDELRGYEEVLALADTFYVFLLQLPSIYNVSRNK